jgi:hypothetical protein
MRRSTSCLASSPSLLANRPGIDPFGAAAGGADCLRPVVFAGLSGWALGMRCRGVAVWGDAVWDATFPKNSDRLLDGEVAGKFLAAVVSITRAGKN